MSLILYLLNLLTSILIQYWYHIANAAFLLVCVITLIRLIHNKLWLPATSKPQVTLTEDARTKGRLQRKCKPVSKDQDTESFQRAARKRNISPPHLLPPITPSPRGRPFRAGTRGRHRPERPDLPERVPSRDSQHLSGDSGLDVEDEQLVSRVNSNDHRDTSSEEASGRVCDVGYLSRGNVERLSKSRSGHRFDRSPRTCQPRRRGRTAENPALESSRHALSADSRDRHALSADSRDPHGRKRGRTRSGSTSPVRSEGSVLVSYICRSCRDHSTDIRQWSEFPGLPSECSPTDTKRRRHRRDSRRQTGRHFADRDGRHGVHQVNLFYQDVPDQAADSKERRRHRRGRNVHDRSRITYSSRSSNTHCERQYLAGTQAFGSRTNTSHGSWVGPNTTSLQLDASRATSWSRSFTTDQPSPYASSEDTLRQAGDATGYDVFVTEPERKSKKHFDRNETRRNPIQASQIISTPVMAGQDKGNSASTTENLTNSVLKTDLVPATAEARSNGCGNTQSDIRKVSSLSSKPMKYPKPSKIPRYASGQRRDTASNDCNGNYNDDCCCLSVKQASEELQNLISSLQGGRYEMSESSRTKTTSGTFPSTCYGSHALDTTPGRFYDGPGVCEGGGRGEDRTERIAVRNTLQRYPDGLGVCCTNSDSKRTTSASTKEWGRKRPAVPYLIQELHELIYSLHHKHATVTPQSQHTRTTHGGCDFHSERADTAKT